MKRYIRSSRRGYHHDYAGAGYVRKPLTLIPRCYDYDYSKGKEAYILRFEDSDGAKYAWYCTNPLSPIFDRVVDQEDDSPMKISCQVKSELDFPAGNSSDYN